MKNDIIIFENQEVKLDVNIKDDTVWLNRSQIAKLFDRDIKTIGKHINNALREELSNCSVVGNFATTATDGKTYNVEYYNIEVITSVGYRVKSKQGVQFRQWANKVLKDYLLRGYAVNQRIETLENRIDNKLYEHEQKIEHLTEQVDFFVRTSLPPIEGVFHNNQVFDAHILMSDLVKQAKVRIIIIDNYVDDSVLTLLSKRKTGLIAEIYTYKKSEQFTLDIDKHNLQYPSVIVHVNKTCHDRFIIIDDKVYHVGASIKDLGKKLCAVSLLTCIDANEMLNKIV